MFKKYLTKIIGTKLKWLKEEFMKSVTWLFNKLVIGYLSLTYYILNKLTILCKYI